MNPSERSLRAKAQKNNALPLSLKKKVFEKELPSFGEMMSCPSIEKET